MPKGSISTSAAVGSAVGCLGLGQRQDDGLVKVTDDQRSLLLELEHSLMPLHTGGDHEVAAIERGVLGQPQREGYGNMPAGAHHLFGENACRWRLRKIEELNLQLDASWQRGIRRKAGGAVDNDRWRRAVAEIAQEAAGMEHHRLSLFVEDACESEVHRCAIPSLAPNRCRSPWSRSAHFSLGPFDPHPRSAVERYRDEGGIALPDIATGFPGDAQARRRADGGHQLTTLWRRVVQTVHGGPSELDINQSLWRSLRGYPFRLSACGMRTTTDNPPRLDFENANSPPITWMRSETMDNPSPQPGLFSSRRLPRRAASPASAGGPDAARRPLAGILHQVALVGFEIGQG